MDPSETFFFDQARYSWQRDPRVTFMCVSARFGDVRTLSKLLQEALEADNAFMSSPAVGLILKRATQAKQLAVLECLVQAGMDVNTPFKVMNLLRSSLFYCCIVCSVITISPSANHQYLRQMVTAQCKVIVVIFDVIIMVSVEMMS
jgi:hypothetical protein